MGGDHNEDDEVIGVGMETGKGKAKAPSSRKTAKKGGPSSNVILSLRKDIPVMYAPLQNPLADDELLELNWFVPTHLDTGRGKTSDKGKMNPKALVEGVPAPASPAPPTRRWHSFGAPRMIIDHGEPMLLDGVFCFPFEPQVIIRFSSLEAFLTSQIIGEARGELSSS
jgi:hypothetical protein